LVGTDRKRPESYYSLHCGRGLEQIKRCSSDTTAPRLQPRVSETKSRCGFLFVAVMAIAALGFHALFAAVAFLLEKQEANTG